MTPEVWLALFGAFFGGVLKGWLGEGRGNPDKLDPLAPKDQEAERNRKAREAIKAGK
jgi:hypothetical protein